MTRYTVILEEKDGDLILPLPKELFEGDNPWAIGDKLDWLVKDNNTAIITNLTCLLRNKDK